MLEKAEEYGHKDRGRYHERCKLKGLRMRKMPKKQNSVSKRH